MFQSQKKWIRGGLLAALTTLVSIQTQRFCHKRTDGFSLNKICSDLSYHSEWETPPPPDNLKGIFGQSFHYLAKGAQCHAFVSEDGGYVLKFFRHHHMRPPAWLSLVPPTFASFKAKKEKKKRGKLKKDFNSYFLAYTELKEETGLVYLHLNKSDYLNQSVTIYDKIGAAYILDLDRMEFILQKRATLVYPTFDSWIEGGHIETAKRALTDLVALLKLRLSKGLYDKDPDLNTNFGFLGTQPVQIDVGRFKLCPTHKDEEEKRDIIMRTTDNLKQRLEAKHPALANHLKSEIAK